MRYWTRLAALVLAVLVALAASVATGSAAYAAAPGRSVAAAPDSCTPLPGPGGSSYCGSPSPTPTAPIPSNCSGLLGSGLKVCLAQAKAKFCSDHADDARCTSSSAPSGTSDPVTNAINSALNSTVVKPMAQGLAQFDSQIIQQALAAALTQKSVSIEDSGVTSSNSETLGGTTVTYSLQGICLGVGEIIAVLLVLWQSIRTMVQRKGTPLAEALLGLAINVVVTLSGIAILDSLLVASDALTSDLIAVPFAGGNTGLGDRMNNVLLVTTGFNPMAQLVMAAMVFLAAGCLAVMMFLRQAALPAQALLLPIASAGQIGSKGTRQWLPRLWTSMIMVIAYKPAAALLVALGFVELGHGVGIADWIRGMVTLALSILAMPTMMRLFAPLGIAAAGASTGGLAQTAMAMGMLGSRFGGGGSGGGASEPTSAVQHAAQMARTGPAANPVAAAGGAVEQAARNSAPPQPAGQDPNSVYVPVQGANGSGQGPAAPGQDGGRDGSGSPSARPSGMTVTMRGAEATSRAANAAGTTVSEGGRESNV
jgi:type IV secretion system protein TrbL